MNKLTDFIATNKFVVIILISITFIFFYDRFSEKLNKNNYVQYDDIPSKNNKKVKYNDSYSSYPDLESIITNNKIADSMLVRDNTDSYLEDDIFSLGGISMKSNSNDYNDYNDYNVKGVSEDIAIGLADGIKDTLGSKNI